MDVLLQLRTMVENADPKVNLPAGVGFNGGLLISSSDPIRSFLHIASKDSSELPLELQTLASELSAKGSIPYKSLRAIWSAAPPSVKPPLSVLFSGANFIFCSPKPREKSKELKERLKKLEEMAERKAYRELVKDVLPKGENVEPFSSYKDQIGFGMHVVLMMFTGYLVGFAAFRALFNHSAVMNAAGGILGLICGLLLETVLFIIRTSTRDAAISSKTSVQKRTQ